jgi:pimeloyl-ACP methyl ester carboxylesterase
MDKKLKKILIGDLSWKRLLRSILSVLLFTYLGLMAAGYFLADKMMFPAPDVSYTDKEDITKLTMADGIKISAKIYKTENPDFYILYNHGNGVDLGVIDEHLKRASQQLKSTVLAYDYPGYGTSGGKPSEESISAAADTAYEYLKSQGIQDNQIIIWGRSVGSGPATYLADKYPVAGLILESPFKSAFTVVTRVPIIPFDKFANIAIIDKINCPLFVLHGKDDNVIPFFHGEAIYNAADEPKMKLWVSGAGHNNLSYIAGKNYWHVFKEYLGSIKKLIHNK